MNGESTTSQSGPARRRLGEGGFFGPRALVALLLCTGVACLVVAQTPTVTSGGVAFSLREALAKASQRTLTFAERASYQRVIEETLHHKTLSVAGVRQQSNRLPLGSQWLRRRRNTNRVS